MVSLNGCSVAKFPKEFLWGCAISAHQVEGNNIHNDWWDDEVKGIFKFRSGNACKHYELYEQDFDLARALNHNALRLSIEWSRIEPKEGEFAESELKHYEDVVQSLKKRSIEPIITLHHFTNPLWFNKLGAWQNKRAGYYFLRFVKKILDSISPYVKYWVTINEPTVYLYYGYLFGLWPPHKKGIINTLSAAQTLISTHIHTYKLIHEIYQKNNLSKPYVSVAANLRFFSACKNDFKSRFAVYIRNKLYNLMFLECLYRRKAMDFIGINYYTRENVSIWRPSINNILFETCKDVHAEVNKNSLGWDIYPEGLYKLLLKLKKFNLPVFILENGICTHDDHQRWNFISEHLKYLYKAMQEGLDVLGYLYWSLLDNFEWDKGFEPRFGIVEVDYTTYERRIRESAKKYAQLCRGYEL